MAACATPVEHLHLLAGDLAFAAVLPELAECPANDAYADHRQPLGRLGPRASV